ncbi:MAG: peptide deformylase [Opitutae bacterium]|jgi:peptide deformylase|nr:peptide deformylase [Opitutae bacterium]|tara:strand:+ start:152 stop:724 length:573 start_codon:yes stop_codon:yes gene_type:complete
MLLRITHYDEPILRLSGEEVTIFDDKLGQLAEDMIDTMHEAEGIGLAAQQVGKALRFCVVEIAHNPENPITCIFDGKPLNPDLLMPLALANPEIEELPGEDMVYEEGCLSFPEIRGDVVRADRVRVRYLDLKGTEHVLECDGLLSRCIQHETDHLAGILFIDRMEPEVLAEIKPEVKELKRLTKKAINKK